jgi:cytochrome c biogenesis protein CcmG/thiol:disulfide interchange protein DsbE
MGAGNSAGSKHSKHAACAAGPKAEPMQKSVDQPERPDPQPRRTRALMVPIVLFAAVALLFGYALTNSDPSKLPSALIGKPAPVAELPALVGLAAGGKPVPGLSVDDLKRGDPVVVNFFASWCVPCVQEHPMLGELKKLTGVRLVGVNHKDPDPGGLRFLQRYGNPYDVVGVDGNGRASIEWGVYGMPETFVVDGQGRIVYKHVGPITPQTMTRMVIPAIEKAKAGK